MTGTVIDSGDGVTHVIPVSDGYVIGSSIKHIPLAGRDITQFISQFIRDRESAVPPEDLYIVTQKIKEEFGYVCSDIAKEFKKFDEDPKKHISKFSGIESSTKKKWEIDVGAEKFLGPELFFNPEIFSTNFDTPLPTVVDNCIQSSPIDCRRPLYNNIVLSGGSTMFQFFDRRLQRDVKDIVERRLNLSEKLTGHKPKDIDVNVLSHPMQRYAVWFGGSMLGTTPEFYNVCHSKKDYDEKGPSIARYSRVFDMGT